MFHIINFKLLISILLVTLFYKSLVSGEWPNDLKTRFPFPTPAPLHIISSKAKVYATNSSLRFILSSYDTINVTNNGRTIAATPDQNKTKAFVTGSVLGNEVYELYQIGLVFSNNYRDPCGTIIDGKGTPIEIAHVYVNKNYGTIDKAKTERDGVVAVVERIIVNGVIPNHQFPAFRNILEKLKNPGSSVIAPSIDFFQWYERLDEYRSYYIYPGSFTDPMTGHLYDAATIITYTPTVFTFISIPQFDIFRELKAKDGLTLSNMRPIFDMKQTPLIQAEGLKVEEAAGIEVKE